MTRWLLIWAAIAMFCCACSVSGGGSSETENATETDSRSLHETTDETATQSDSSSDAEEDTRSVSGDSLSDTLSDTEPETLSESGSQETSPATDSETRVLPELDTEFTTEGLKSGEMVWIAFAESWREMYGKNVAVGLDGSVYWGLKFDRRGFFPFVERPVWEIEGVAADNTLLVQLHEPTIQWIKQGRSKTSNTRKSEPVGLIADAYGITMVGSYSADDLVFSLGDENETLPIDCKSGACGYVVRFDTHGIPQWVYQPAGTQGVALVAAAPTEDGFAITGFFYDDLLLGEGEENETLLKSEYGLESMFVSSHEKDGTLIWARGEKGGYQCVSYAVAVTPSGALVVVGRYTNQATFGEPGNQVHFETPQIPTVEAFIARYDADGKFEWAKRAVGVKDSFHWGSAVVALEDDSVIFMGFSEKGAPVFGEGEANETKLPAGGFTFARYAADGTLMWAKRGADGNVRPSTAVALPDGDIIVGGSTNSACAFGVGEPGQVIFDDPVFHSVYGFIARYRDDGTLVWVKRYGQSTNYLGDNFVYDVALSPDGKAIYVTGTFGGKDVVFAKDEPNEVTHSSYRFPQTLYDTPVGAVLMRLMP